jgi:predicted nucleotidyltransferase component of viral defense system
MMFESDIHKSLLMRILKEIYVDDMLSQVLGFKGGTALFLFYELSRYSVDLDFDLLDSSVGDLVFEKIALLLSEYGVLKNKEHKRFSYFYLLSYANKTSGAQNIKVEINKRSFSSSYEMKNYMGIAVRVMVQADMAAHKLVAMYERIGKAQRDIFDTWFMLTHQWPINSDIIFLRTGLTLKMFLEACIIALRTVNNRSILAGLGELLAPQQKIWVKKSLIEETIFLLQLRIETL